MLERKGTYCNAGVLLLLINHLGSSGTGGSGVTARGPAWHWRLQRTLHLSCLGGDRLFRATNFQESLSFGDVPAFRSLCFHVLPKELEPSFTAPARTLETEQAVEPRCKMCGVQAVGPSPESVRCSNPSRTPREAHHVRRRQPPQSKHIPELTRASTNQVDEVRKQASTAVDRRGAACWIRCQGRWRESEGIFTRDPATHNLQSLVGCEHFESVNLPV